jgi:hypothetical protein
MPPTPAQETYQKGSIWPTIGTIVLLIVILLLGAALYISYGHNKQLAHENSDLKVQVQAITADKEALTLQVNDLAKKLAEIECDGVWDGDSCEPYPVSITARAASGTSPFSAAFTVKAKSSKYGVDYGDGTAGWLTGGPNPSTGGECVPKDDGLCEFRLTHVFKNATENDATFEVKITKDGKTSASTVITVPAKK